MAESRSKIILYHAAADPKIRAKLIELGKLRESFTNPAEFAPMIMEFSHEVGLLGKGATSRETSKEYCKWLFEHINLLADYASNGRRLKPGERYVKRVGKVFLSWTVKSTRDRAAITGIEKALDYFNVEYFDYTLHQLDDSKEVNDEIVSQLKRAVSAASISIEVYPAELGSPWMDFERTMIRESGIESRIFVCLDEEAENRLFTDGSEERIVSWANMSDGQRSATCVSGSEDGMGAAADTTYYQSTKFLARCFRLVWRVRRLLDPQPTNWLQKVRDIITLKQTREFETFIDRARKQ